MCCRAKMPHRFALRALHHIALQANPVILTLKSFEKGKITVKKTGNLKGQAFAPAPGLAPVIMQ